MLKEPRIRSKKHLKFISQLPCCVSGRHGETQAAHIRAGCFSLGMKPGDNCVIPLSVAEHRLQHEIGEEMYYGPLGGVEKAKKLAKDLFSVSGNYDAALKLIASYP
jgi:hypothetical protein